MAAAHAPVDSLACVTYRIASRVQSHLSIDQARGRTPNTPSSARHRHLGPEHQARRQGFSFKSSLGAVHGHTTR